MLVAINTSSSSTIAIVIFLRESNLSTHERSHTRGKRPSDVLLATWLTAQKLNRNRNFIRNGGAYAAPACMDRDASVREVNDEKRGEQRLERV